MARATPAKPNSADVEQTNSTAWRRWVVSAVLLLHLTAVVLPPLTMQTNRSPAVAPAMDAMAPYIDAAFLNHGYAFFAPNPPEASHLIRYRVEFDDGRPPVEHVFPDRKRHWPRLLYHRHFMLSEQLRMDFVRPFPPEDATAEQVAEWREQRNRYEARWNSFEQHLLAKYGGDRITMVRVLHHVPPPFEGIGGINLHHPDFYVELDKNGEPVRSTSDLPVPEPRP